MHPTKLKRLHKLLLRVEEPFADLASPMVWLFSSAPASVLNAITSLMPALVILLVFHSGLVIANGCHLHEILCRLIGVEP